MIKILNKVFHFEHNVKNYQNIYMMNDICVLVNELDQVKGYANKQICHELKDGKPPLHRAFSIFLFRKKFDSLELLMQQRASSKLTYPNLWSNTCCSHPLKNYPLELDENQAIGVKLAAQRKIEHEVGLDNKQQLLSISNIHYLSRIIYFANNESCHPEASCYAEHELDYLLISFLKESDHDPELRLNKDEVQNAEWINARRLMDSFLSNQCTLKLTPWLRGLIKTGLFKQICQSADQYYSDKIRDKTEYCFSLSEQWKLRNGTDIIHMKI